MVLVSLVLVVLAAVTLVIGLLQSGVTIIYISIGCSLVAGIVLFVAVRRGRPEPVPVGAPGGPGWAPSPPQAAPGQAAPAAQPPAEPVGAMVGGAAPAPPSGEPASWGPDSTQQFARVGVEEEAEAPVEAGDLPIADYDRLRATDIIPLLADLDRAELEEVRAHEDSHKHRFTVLRRIDDALAAREEADESPGWEVSEEEWEAPAEEAEGEPIAVDEIETLEVAEEEPLEDIEVQEEPEPEPEPDFEPEPVATAPRRRGGVGFPIANYDSLMMLEVLPQLVRLDPDELMMVRQHEEAGLSRSTILNRIDRLVQQKGSAARRYAEPEPALTRTRSGRAAAKKAPARKAAAAKKAPARRTGIKQAAAKTPAAKRSASIKKTPAKKAAKKAAAKKAPAKRAGTAKKTTGRRTR